MESTSKLMQSKRLKRQLIIKMQLLKSIMVKLKSLMLPVSQVIIIKMLKIQTLVILETMWI